MGQQRGSNQPWYGAPCGTLRRYKKQRCLCLRCCQCYEREAEANRIHLKKKQLADAHARVGLSEKSRANEACDVTKGTK